MLYEDFASFRITWDFRDNFRCETDRQTDRRTERKTESCKSREWGQLWAGAEALLSCNANRDRDRRHVTLPSL